MKYSDSPSRLGLALDLPPEDTYGVLSYEILKSSIGDAAEKLSPMLYHDGYVRDHFSLFNTYLRSVFETAFTDECFENIDMVHSAQVMIDYVSENIDNYVDDYPAQLKTAGRSQVEDQAYFSSFNLYRQMREHIDNCEQIQRQLNPRNMPIRNPNNDRARLGRMAIGVLDLLNYREQ